jgi:hypothetical protein
MKTCPNYTLVACAVVLVLATCLAGISWAQQEPNRVPPAPALTGNATAQQGDNAGAVQNPDDNVFRVLGSGQLLRIEPGDIRVGPFYLTSVGVSGDWSRITGSDQPDYTEWMGWLTGNLVFDKQYQNNRISFQYQPKLIAANGTVSPDLLNQSILFTSLFRLSPRWKMTFGDSFNYFSNQATLIGTPLYSDFTTGYIQQNDLLNRPGHWLTDNTNIALTYDLGARTKIDLTPIVGYVIESGNGQTTSGLSLGGMVTITRQLTPRESIGVYTGFVQNELSNISNNTSYYSTGINYTRQFGTNWFLSASGGAVLMHEPQEQIWTGQGSVNLTKAWRRTSVALTYTRSSAFQTTLQNGFVDQAAITITRYFSRRLSGNFGFGSYGELWTTAAAGNDTARYGNVGLSYWLGGNFFSSCSYFQRRQSGPQLVPGRGDYLILGLQWSPGGRRQNN